MAPFSILIVRPANITGVEYHRQMIPAYHLAQHHKGAFDITVINSVSHFTGTDFANYQLCVFTRIIDNPKATCAIARKAGCKTILDIDDLWNLPHSHLLHETYKQQAIGRKTIDSIKSVDLVTTTQPYFADAIKQINRNVEILPNAIWPEQPQWESTTTPIPVWSEPTSTNPPPQPTNPSVSRMRFGWLGGICHYDDIALLKDSFQRFYFDEQLSRKAQLVLCGFNLSQQFYDKGKLETLHQEQQEFYKFEQIFTNDYKGIPLAYSILLHMFIDDELVIDRELPYRRVWSKDVWNYATMYETFDVALVPLADNKFNACKSELKLIEAGFKKKAVICSDVLPYSPILTYNNSIRIAPNKNNRGWYKAIKRLTDNPSQVQDLSEGLFETVKDKYHIETVNQKRIQVWNHLITS